MSAPGVRRIAYLSSTYARASDSFIREEVAALRRRRMSVATFAVRAPNSSELVSDEVRASYEETTYILSAGVLPLAAAALQVAAFHPYRFATGIRLAGRLATPGLRGRLWPFIYLVEASYLAVALRQQKIQHLHNHIGEGSAAVALLGAELAGISHSLTIHGPGEWDRPQTLALDLKVSRAAFVVAISDYTRGQLLRWCDPEHWGKIHVIRCGVNPAVFGTEAATPVPDVRRFVTVGRLAPEKGQALLISALGRLKQRGIEATLVVVGDGPEKANLERQAQRCGVGSAVTFAGWVAAEQVANEIRASRAVIMPSLAEGLPVVLMEALSLGRPVVSTSVAAVPELVRAHESGWLVAPGSVEDLAEALRAVLATSLEELTAMGTRGAVRVAAEHSIDTQVEKMISLLRVG